MKLAGIWIHSLICNSPNAKSWVRKWQLPLLLPVTVAVVVAVVSEVDMEVDADAALVLGIIIMLVVGVGVVGVIEHEKGGGVKSHRKVVRSRLQKVSTPV